MDLGSGTGRPIFAAALLGEFKQVCNTVYQVFVSSTLVVLYINVLFIEKLSLSFHPHVHMI